MRHLVALALVVSALADCANAQSSPAEFHERVVEFIATRAPTMLPTGDTLVSWNADRPVLFHTASRDGSGVRAGMLRGDRMLGVSEVRWTAAGPSSFVVQWLTPRPSSMDSLTIHGTVASDGLHISRSGRPDTLLTIPRGLWAVADYGMEELLLPIFDSISTPLPSTVMVLRPYVMKWDSLHVSAGPSEADWRVIRWVDRGNERWTATVQGPHLLWVRRSAHADNEKVPLEGTMAREALDRIRARAEPASRPR